MEGEAVNPWAVTDIFCADLEMQFCLAFAGASFYSLSKVHITSEHHTLAKRSEVFVFSNGDVGRAQGLPTVLIHDLQAHRFSDLLTLGIGVEAIVQLYAYRQYRCLFIKARPDLVLLCQIEHRGLWWFLLFAAKEERAQEQWP